MTDKEAPEPVIIINGELLSHAQSMAVRVAVMTVIAEMRKENALGDDARGVAMAAAYRRRLAEVLAFMIPEEEEDEP